MADKDFYRQSLESSEPETLQAMCKARDLATDGGKGELIARLVEYHEEAKSVSSITISSTKIKRKSQRNKPGSKQKVIPPVELLVDGYIREQYMQKYKQLFPHDLTKVFCEFLDHIWVLPEKYNHVMKRNGRFIFRPPLNNKTIVKERWYGRDVDVEMVKNVDMIIGYSRGCDKGVLEFSLKCIKPARDAIGIMSDIDQCEIEQWIPAAKGNTYYYVGGSSVASGGGIYSGSFTKNGGEQYIDREPAWRTGDVIKMRVDCNEWTCMWFKNEQQVGHTVHIEPNCAYHPVLATSKDGIEYELIL